MRITLSICVIISILLPIPCMARDFIVQFVEENYKEERLSFSYSPLIYHSIQVTTPAGPKLLILKGDNYQYRAWIRNYISQDKALVVKVPEEKADLFITSSAVEVDITDLHPLNLDRYRYGQMLSQTDPDRFGGPMTDIPDLAEIRRRSMEAERARKEELARKNAKAQALQKNADQKAAQQKQSKEQAALEKQKEKEQEAAQLREKQKLEQEKERLDQERRLAEVARQQAMDEEERKKELEARWQELRSRLLSDERIRKLERAEREKELYLRWLELKQRYDIL